MNRAARRALAKNLSKALGRAGAHRPAEDDGPSVEERLAKLEAEKAELQERLAGVESRHDQVPGVTPGRKDWYVHVGGEKVDLKAIPPAEWLRTLEELPSFLFAFALERVETKAPSSETLDGIADLARRWITACAMKPDELQLDRLTLPEAEHAVAHIAELNGVTAHLRAWFRQRLEGMAAAARSSQSVRGATVEPTGDLPN